MRASATGDVHTAAAHGTSRTSTTLPHLEQIRRLFGRHDVCWVRAYVGDLTAEAARAMGAQAYAIGDRIAFADLLYRCIIGLCAIVPAGQPPGLPDLVPFIT